MHAEAFRARFTGDAAPPGLEEALAALVGAGRAAWPEVEVDPAAFTRHLAERAPAGELPAVLEQLHAVDLYLACACAAGAPGALAAFDRAHLAGAGDYLRRLDPSPAFTDDVVQGLREKLFVGDGDRRPRIGEYNGRGSLASWVRVAAMRTALNLRRARTVALAPAAGAEEELTVEGDAALDLAKARYRPAFQAALQAALAELTAEQRNVLRLHYVDGLTIDKLGVLFKVHRATAARWLADSRDRLRSAIKAELQARLGVSSGECESLVGLLYSQLEVSLGVLLGPR